MTSIGIPGAAALDETQAGDGRPLLFTGARLLTGDPLIGTLHGDVLLGGAQIVGVGPGLPRRRMSSRRPQPLTGSACGWIAPASCTRN